MAFAGNTSFNPAVDSIARPDGTPFKFRPPTGKQFPPDQFARGNVDFYPAEAMPPPQPLTDVIISPSSDRLQVLEPFPSHFGEHNSRGLELPPLKVLMRVRGKCTTDHISAAGPWLKYKGHLENISENLLITAVNDEGGKTNVAYHAHLPGIRPDEDTIPHTAKRFKTENIPWSLVVDENYGEGSAREHAALQPRYYGCCLIIARSFARIHETNLKKQGILPLWLWNKDDYKRIGFGDVIETVGLPNLFDNDASEVKLRVTTRTGERFIIRTKHTMSREQLQWLRQGSALNYIKTKLSK